MPASVASPADVVNLALVRLGYKTRVGSLYEGSPAAKRALDIYAQTRDAVLRMSDWGFAETIVAAVASADAPPNPPWRYQYQYPANCLRLRAIFGAPYTTDQNDPLPVLFKVADDPAIGRVIWANLSPASLVYTAQVTNPAQWDSLFVEALASELAKRLALSLGDPQAAKAVDENEKDTVKTAQQVVG